MKRILFLAIFASCLLPCYAQKANDIVGYYYYYEWKREEKSQIQVYSEGGKFKGKVVWLEKPNTEDGKPKTDIYNEDKSKRNRNIIGISIFDGLTYDAKKNRWEGTIYDPANGETFSCVVWFGKKGELNIKGYIGSEWMGLSRIIVWTKEQALRK